MVLLLITYSVLIIVLIYIIKWYVHLYRYRNLNVPGPSPYPIFGNIFQIGTQLDDIMKNFQKLEKKYGKLYKLYLGPNIVSVVASDTKFIQQILNSSKHINRTNMYRIFGTILGDGIAFVQGETWRKNRKFISPSFDLSILNEFNSTFNLESDILIQRMGDIIGREIDIGPYINSFAHKIISETSMGIVYKENVQSHIQFVNSIETCFQIGLSRIFSITGISDYLFSLTKQSVILEENIKYCRNYTESIIKQRLRKRKYLNEVNEKNEFEIKPKVAFLDSMLDRYEKTNDMTIEDIRKEIDTILVAGYDTTSTTISFLLYELSLNFSIQEKIYQEISSIMANKTDDFMKLQDMNQMFYTECAIKECLRKHTIIPFIERLIVNDVEIEGIKIPAGTNVTILTALIHNSEENYPNPEIFDPERFYPEQVSRRDQYSFIPFSMGPRNCLGSRYAMYEIKCFLAKLIMKFRFKPVEGFKLEYLSTIVCKSKNGYPIIVERRN